MAHCGEDDDLTLQPCAAVLEPERHLFMCEGGAWVSAASMPPAPAFKFQQQVSLSVPTSKHTGRGHPTTRQPTVQQDRLRRAVTPSFPPMRLSAGSQEKAMQAAATLQATLSGAEDPVPDHFPAVPYIPLGVCGHLSACGLFLDRAGWACYSWVCPLCSV